MIDDVTRPSHRFLEPTDECYFLREYTAGAGYQASDTNDLIFNFKKPPDRRRNQSEWRHKERAIRRFADELHAALNNDWLSIATLVPMPPSKAKNDPNYDDRMVQLLRHIESSGRRLDIRELLIQSRSRMPAHEAERRPNPDELLSVFDIDPMLKSPTPREIGIFDDVLVRGAHFKAAQRCLRGHFSDVRIVGVFLARSIHATTVD